MQGKKSILLAAVAVLLTAVAVWFAQRPVTPKQATWDDVLAEAKAGGYRIITTEELADRYRKDPETFFWWTPARNGSTAPGTSRARSIFPWNRPGGRAGARRVHLKALLGPDKERGRSCSTERA